jgi:hypothetical protein
MATVNAKRKRHTEESDANPKGKRKDAKDDKDNDNDNDSPARDKKKARPSKVLGKCLHTTEWRTSIEMAKKNMCYMCFTSFSSGVDRKQRCANRGGLRDPTKEDFQTKEGYEEWIQKMKSEVRKNKKERDNKKEESLQKDKNASSNRRKKAFKDEEEDGRTDSPTATTKARDTRPSGSRRVTFSDPPRRTHPTRDSDANRKESESEEEEEGLVERINPKHIPLTVFNDYKAKVHRRSREHAERIDALKKDVEKWQLSASEAERKLSEANSLLRDVNLRLDKAEADLTHARRDIHTAYNNSETEDIVEVEKTINRRQRECKETFLGKLHDWAKQQEDFCQRQQKLAVKLQTMHEQERRHTKLLDKLADEYSGSFVIDEQEYRKMRSKHEAYNEQADRQRESAKEDHHRPVGPKKSARNSGKDGGGGGEGEKKKKEENENEEEEEEEEEDGGTRSETSETSEGDSEEDLPLVPELPHGLDVMKALGIDDPEGFKDISDSWLKEHRRKHCNDSEALKEINPAVDWVRESVIPFVKELHQLPPGDVDAKELWQEFKSVVVAARK